MAYSQNMYWPDQSTVWKFQDFTISQILREINFGESESSKNSVIAIFGALNFVNLIKFLPSKSAKIHNKIKIQSL